MGRTIQDDDLRRWEVFATTGSYGGTHPARLVFRCLTERGLRARKAEVEGDKSDAERAVRELPDTELLELLHESVKLD